MIWDRLAEILKNKFAKASILLISIQIVTLLVSFFGNLFLASIFKKASGFGEFNYYFSIITLVGYSACIGIDTFLLKRNTELGIGSATSEVVEISNKSNVVTFGSSLLLSLLTYVVLRFFLGAPNVHVIFTSFGVFFCGFLVLRSHLLRSMGELVFSNLMSQSGRTLMFYLVVVIVYFTIPIEGINIGVFSFVVANLLCWIVIEIVLIPRWLKFSEGVIPSNKISYLYLLKAGIPFFLFDFVGNLYLNLDVLVINYFAGAEYLGNYSFYKKLSLIPFMAINVVGAVLQTQYLDLFKREQIGQLGTLVQKSNRIIFGLALVICLFLIASFFLLSSVENPIKHALFDLYKDSSYMLFFLIGIELLCSAFGPCSYFMVMIGFEKVYFKIDIIFIVIYLLLNGVLYQFLGYDCFLWSYGIIRVSKQVVLWRFIYSRLNISFFLF